MVILVILGAGGKSHSLQLQKTQYICALPAILIGARLNEVVIDLSAHLDLGVDIQNPAAHSDMICGFSFFTPTPGATYFAHVLPCCARAWLYASELQLCCRLHH
ncbi:MAG: hypothetical protein KF899_10525 [Parvibaculum sp.]|nr:hypothetical protein [Parvibaculum sp.]